MDNMEQPQGQSSSGAGKWIVGVIILALVVWAVWANGKKENKKVTEDTMTKSSETLKFGVLLPLTGEAAIYGEPLKNVVLMATDEINAQGKVKIEPIFEDGKCNGKDATSAIQKLVNVDKVQYVVGGGCSGESLAALPTAEQGKVLMASPLSTNPKLTGMSPYFMRLVPSDSAQGEMDANLAIKQGYKTTAVLVEQTDYAMGVYNAFAPVYEKLGGKVVKEEYPSESGDFRTQLTKLKAANPNVLFLVSQSSTAAAKIIKQMQGMNWKPKMYITESLTSDAKFIADNKDFLEGTYGAEVRPDTTNQKYQKLLESYKTKYGKDLNFGSFSAAAYDETYIFAQGVLAVGNNGEKLAQWSRTIKDWPGAAGTITIKADGDSNVPYALSVVKDGKVVPSNE